MCFSIILFGRSFDELHFTTRLDVGMDVVSVDVSMAIHDTSPLVRLDVAGLVAIATIACFIKVAGATILV
jgi:hypothetical protein